MRFQGVLGAAGSQFSVTKHGCCRHAHAIERQVEILQDREVEAWLNEIGQRLGKTTLANACPYCFKMINEDSINAFALQRRTDARSRRLIKADEDKAELPVHSLTRCLTSPRSMARHIAGLAVFLVGLHPRMFSRRRFPVD